MKSPLKGAPELGDQRCALCDAVVPEHKWAFVHFDDLGEMKGVVFTDGRKRTLHKCGVKFKLPPRPKSN